MAAEQSLAHPADPPFVARGQVPDPRQVARPKIPHRQCSTLLPSPVRNQPFRSIVHTALEHRATRARTPGAGSTRPRPRAGHAGQTRLPDPALHRPLARYPAWAGIPLPQPPAQLARAPTRPRPAQPQYSALPVPPLSARFPFRASPLLAQPGGTLPQKPAQKLVAKPCAGLGHRLAPC